MTIPVPADVVSRLKAVLGEFSSEVLGSARVVPSVLENAGFIWEDPTIESAIRVALASR